MSGVTAVVIPTRNRVHLLRQTLLGVRWQSHPGVTEVVVVDEGSSDATPQYLQKVRESWPAVRVIRNDDPVGLPAARNLGMSLVTVPWVAFCDDDDVWAPDKLAAQHRAMAALPGARWSCVGSVSIDVRGRVLSAHQPPATGEVREELLRENVVPGGGSGVLVDRRLLLEVGSFTESLQAAEDWDAWLRLSARSPLAAVDRALLGYRVGGTSMSHELDRMTRSLAVISELWGTASDRGRARFLARQAMRNSHRRLALSYFRRSWQEERDLQDLVGAASALTWPGLYDRARALAVPRAYRDEAKAWLGALRTSPDLAGRALSPVARCDA